MWNSSPRLRPRAPTEYTTQTWAGRGLTTLATLFLSDMGVARQPDTAPPPEDPRASLSLMVRLLCQRVSSGQCLFLVSPLRCGSDGALHCAETLDVHPLVTAARRLVGVGRHASSRPARRS